MAERDNTQEMMTLEAYLDSKAAHMDKAAIAGVAQGILSGDIDAVVEIERKPYAGHDPAGLLRHGVMPTEYGRATFWKRKELLDMKLGRDFDSSVLGAIMICVKAEAPNMPEPAAPSHEATPDAAPEKTSKAFTAPDGTKGQKQEAAVLFWIAYKEWNPQAVPDSEKATVKKLCEGSEETMRLFTYKNAFDETWRRLRKNNLVRTESHDSYIRRGK